MADNFDVNDVCALETFCTTHGLDYRRVRRMARKRAFDDNTTFNPFQIFDRWCVRAADTPPTMPDVVMRGVQRTDGRIRFTVYVNETELAQLRTILPNDAIVDPRVKRAARRAAKRANKTDGDTSDK